MTRCVVVGEHAVRRLLCELRGIWRTLTLDLFWRSLLAPPLVTFEGHSWPWPPDWGPPEPSPDPEEWPGPVEYDVSRCEDCGHQSANPAWRRFYGSVEAPTRGH